MLTIVFRMDIVKQFVIKNPDALTKLKVTTVAFGILALCYCGSLLTSLVLTLLYAVTHAAILYIVREYNILNLNQVYDFDEAVNPASDSEDYFYDDELRSPSLREFDLKFNDTAPGSDPVGDQRVFTPRLNLNKYGYNSIPNKKAIRHSPKKLDHHSPTYSISSYYTRSSPSPKPGTMSGYGHPSLNYRPNAGSGTAKIGASIPTKTDSPELFGVNRYALSREPLRPRPAAVNLTSSAFGQNFVHRKHTKHKAGNTMSTLTMLGASQYPISRGPQTSSPFQEKSRLGLWNTINLSAVASPDGLISPIGSPARESILNRSSPYSPSPGEGASFRQRGLHQSTGQPVDAKRHVQPSHAPSSMWQRWSKGQTTVKLAGRPRVQSPVTVRIAQPDRGPGFPEKRYLKRPSVLEDPPDPLRKDVILSALRDKRKRGKPGLDESGGVSQDSMERSTEGGSRLKKRRLDVTTDGLEPSRTRPQRPKRPQQTLVTPVARRPAAPESSGPSRATEERSTRYEGEPADDSMDVSTVNRCPRNAILSSLSSSRILKGRHRKRGPQIDDEEPEPSPVPPKKVSRATDVSGLVPEADVDGDKESVKEGAAQDLETSQEEEHQKTVLSPRQRKRGVFTSIHKGKQNKPPSPHQVTAADLHEDRQRALERYQQMRTLLREESSEPKETSQASDKPLLPAAKPPSTTASSTLLSFPAVKPATTGNLTMVDTGAVKVYKVGESVPTQLFKKDPITKNWVEQSNTGSRSKNPTSSSGLGLFEGVSTPLSVSVSTPATTQSPLLQALSSMKGTTPSTGPKTTDSATPAGGLGLTFGQGNSLSSTLSSAAPTSTLPTSVTSILSSSTGQGGTTSTPTLNFGGSMIAGSIGGSSGISSSLSGSTAARSVQPASQPTVQFGAGNPLLQTQVKDTTDQIKTTSQPTVTFGAPSISLGGGFAAPQVSQLPTSKPPAYGSQVTSSNAPSANLFGGSGNTPSVGAFTFGGSGNQTQSAQSTTTTSSATLGTASPFVFGQSAATTASQQSLGSSSLFSGGGTNAATTKASSGLFSFGAPTTTAATSAAPSGGFSFGAPPAAKTATDTATQGLFMFGASTGATTASTPSLFQSAASAPTPKAPTGSLSAPSPFTFGAATPGTDTANKPAAPTFNFGGQPTSSSSVPSGFTFGSQNKPAPQATLFPTAAKPASQPSGFTFGGQSAPAKPLFPAAANTQQQPQQQSGFSFGNQPAAPSFGASASAQAFNFGGTNQSAPAAAAPSPFQFGGASSAAPTQQKSAPAFNFTGASNPTTFAFGGGSSAPQFGQGQMAMTPPRPGGGFSIGSTATAPRKSASARMRQRARAGRK